MTTTLLSLLLTLLGATTPEATVHTASISATASSSPGAESATDADGAIKPSDAPKNATVRYKSPLGKRVADALPEIFASKLSPLDKRRLGSKVFSESRISIARGTFPDGGALVVFVNVNLRNKDPEAPPKFIGGVVTLSDAASLVSVALPLQTRTQRLDLEAVTDVDGDGVDEIVYTAKDQTSTTRNRIRWTDEGPKSSALPPAG